MLRLSKIFSRLFVLPLFLLLSGCNLVVMAPSGDIAVQQRDLIVISVVLMLIIIIPVIFLTLFFAWKYRQSNTAAPYDPEWHHSTRLELVIWSAPLAIIIALGAVTWISTHQLDPYRPLDRIAAGKPVAENVKPLTVEVVALDWKWLFFYPDLGIATVNELAAPVDTPINFKITASAVMNSFFVPALAGQIYAMPGMETKLHAVINHPGEYQGLSANYSGAGFSHMRFKFHGFSQADFDQWVAKAKSQGSALGRPEYLALAKPSEREPVRYYNAVDKDLYEAILNMCADPSKMCMSEMMHIDAKGGAGKDSQENRERLIHDNRDADHADVTPVRADAPAAHSMQHGDNSMPGMDMGDGSSSNSSTGSSQPARHQDH
ncbi:ubiquinol oxidase subunit II [Agrobacterium sp. SHOUNA12C]|uniref:ubiquinol oxidase subunit II n=1 Tax=Rhizobium rhizogenes TaxID=359 RepID=UPI001239AB3E|nr:ubiquinol oxidase subunit II [Rhizobium rhizogenes]KAA6487249.1 ubiquinol oxidase subunit II [Agrobacterium sp. ICMP 7243]MCJ9725497.1 ubiquinol oxidase subunit II [Agrobacterium sp. BETTINA12B]MCJ9760290.1 ubiquinol oxidase subunit II [Agrobacterium sp. SHOUNA12C]NTF46807.1 ubiquinol oxidase subunit II [Rhizobium rhizogenes]NTF92154.1 ubiquinol oxidase subunit II [Rhizobium rhizogenes]